MNSIRNYDAKFIYRILQNNKKKIKTEINRLENKQFSWFLEQRLREGGGG